jgi:ribosomal protein L37AE/L43A
MTNEQIASRCQNCGCAKKEHNVRKPYACPTRGTRSHWTPWTAEAYEAAQEAGKAAGEPQEAAPAAQEPAACPHCGKRAIAPLEGKAWECHDCGETFDWPAQEAAPRALDITPNFAAMFTQFLNDAASAGATLSSGLCAAQFDTYPETPKAFARRAAVLRAVQAFVAPATIALQCATSGRDIERIREVMAQTLERLNKAAAEYENEAEEN